MVDDYLMKITHAFRGEEWLSSAPVHVLLWKYLFGLDKMPQWAHLPLILGPNGKLSKRDGAKYGFPVFAMNWTDPKTNELTEGFKEKGFLPEAFINLLAVLGWNDGTEQELYSMEELIESFSINRVHVAGAKFDYEKAKWFNHEWIKRVLIPLDWLQPTNQPFPKTQQNNPLIGASTVEPLSVSNLKSDIKKIFEEHGIAITVADELKFEKMIFLIKDRCTLLPDFYEQGKFFWVAPKIYDEASIKPKWDEGKVFFFKSFTEKIQGISNWESAVLENIFKELATEKNIKVGELQMIFRIMLVGSKMGPGVFVIAETIGNTETLNRIKKALTDFSLF